MCTLIAIHARSPTFPLVVAANRDELYARPAGGPRRVHDAPVAVAGVDLVAGGTWMGANARGIFAALTNQRTHEPPDARRASRGGIVLDALAEESVAGIDALLEALDPGDFNGFNLLYGAAGALRVAYSRPEASAVEIEALGPGLWIVPNDRIGSPDFPKADRARALVEPLLALDGPALLAGLTAALADHDEPPPERVPAAPPGSRFDRGMLRRLQALCIHTAEYGTRSSAVVALGDGRVERYLFADGPPCSTEFADVTSLLS